MYIHCIYVWTRSEHEAQFWWLVFTWVRYVHFVRLGESHHAPPAGNQERQERPARRCWNVPGCHWLTLHQETSWWSVDIWWMDHRQRIPKAFLPSLWSRIHCMHLCRTTWRCQWLKKLQESKTSQHYRRSRWYSLQWLPQIQRAVADNVPLRLRRPARRKRFGCCRMKGLNRMIWHTTRRHGVIIDLHISSYIFHLDDKSWPKCCDWLLLTLRFVPLIQNWAPDPSGVIDRDPVLMQGFHQDIWGIWGWINIQCTSCG